ncbi:MAG TPA: HlyD family efflux transporter periplasmic adaptor subunit [Stenotrophomonas sp.]|nr:HlyD family efflux transporter periplasmic adaptor subunit [Stenotrophomonas sp.]
MALAAAVAATLVVVFLVLAPYTRRASVAGQLVPTRGLATVVAPMRGVVTELAVEEGGAVRAGQTLAQLRLPASMTDGGDTIDALRAQLQQRRAGLQAAHEARLEVSLEQEAGLRRQREAARQELARTRAEVEARRQQQALSQQGLARLRELHRERFVSSTQVEQQQNAALEYAGHLYGMQRLAAASARAIAQLEQALAELPGQRLTANAEYQRGLAQLAQEQLELDARGAQAVKAPLNGWIASQLVKAGQAVEAGQALLSVLPREDMLEAELWVPSRSIGFVAPGNAVMLRYQAFPYQKFGHQQGVVRRVSRNAMVPRNSYQAGGTYAANEPHYRVIVALRRQSLMAYGKPERLRPGMLLEADILGERRRLIEWIFEPLYSVHGRVGTMP